MCALRQSLYALLAAGVAPALSRKFRDEVDMMAHSNLGGRHDSAAGDACKGEDSADARLPLPADAQQTLDRIAEALGVTTALLRPHGDAGFGDDVRLAEATELLQAFIRIADPETRKRCVAFVQREAKAARTL